jgi:hypothetical protein
MINKDSAIELAAEYLAKQFLTDAREGRTRISDEWPGGCYRRSEDPVWSLNVPSRLSRVGPDRVLVIFQVTGEVIFDGMVGE